MEDATFVSEEDQEGTIGVDDNNEDEVERALCQWNWNQAATLASTKAKASVRMMAQDSVFDYFD